MNNQRNRNWSIRLIDETICKKLVYFSVEMGLELARKYKTGQVKVWKKRLQMLETANEFNFNGVVYGIELNNYCCGFVQLRCDYDDVPKEALCYTPKATDDCMFKNIYISPKFRQLGGFRSVFALVEQRHSITEIQLHRDEIKNHEVELTRFSGHPTVRFGGVQDGKQDDNPVHAGV
jgi:hypothetical protein